MKHKHAEAFYWMCYSNSDGSLIKWIYNSRDGVTPFITQMNGQELQSVPRVGIYAPNYKPQKGDLCWTTITEEQAKAIIKARIDIYPQFLEGRDPDEIINSGAQEYLKNKEPYLSIADGMGGFSSFHKGLMDELLEILEGATNVQSINFDNETKQWLVTYKNGLPTNNVASELLFEFLTHA